MICLHISIEMSAIFLVDFVRCCVCVCTLKRVAQKNRAIKFFFRLKFEGSHWMDPTFVQTLHNLLTNTKTYSTKLIEKEVEPTKWERRTKTNSMEKTKARNWNESILQHVIKLFHWTRIRMYVLFRAQEHILCAALMYVIWWAYIVQWNTHTLVMWAQCIHVLN